MGFNFVGFIHMFHGFTDFMFVFLVAGHWYLDTVGSDLSDIYLSGNLIYPTEDWGTKCAAYLLYRYVFIRHLIYLTSFEGTDAVG